TGTQANLRYVFPAALTIANGATLNVASGVSVLIRDSITLTVAGTLNVTSAASFAVEDIFNNDVEGITVATGGLLAISGTNFTRSNGTNNTINTSSIQVASGGHLTASGSTFNWDQLSLNSTSILNTGEMTGDAFDTTLFVPATDVPLLTNNVR